VGLFNFSPYKTSARPVILSTHDKKENNIFYIYSGRTKYSAFVSKLIKLSEKYLSLQKPQKAAVFFNRKIFGGRMI
jgi:hypothetical protein